MLGYFKGIFKLKSTFILLYLSLFSLSLSLVRIAFTRRLMFLFLMWNLFLAFVPWLLTSFLHVRKIKNRLFFSIIIFAWIIFFPNAPYILTDLIHLGKEKSVPIWFDLILLLSCRSFVRLCQFEFNRNPLKRKIQSFRLQRAGMRLDLCFLFRHLYRQVFALEQLEFVYRFGQHFYRCVCPRKKSGTAFYHMGVYFFVRNIAESYVLRF